MYNISGEFSIFDSLRNMVHDLQEPSSYEANLLISVNNNPHAHSKVYLGKEIAVKMYDAEELCWHDICKIENEISLLKQLNHKGVLDLFSTFVTGTRIAYVMPLMECGSCQDLMEKQFPTGLPECWISLIVKNVLEALQFIHNNGIIHRAIRARHIILNRYGSIKLNGFRYAFKNLLDEIEPVHDFPYDSTPNLNWLSPEILKQDRLGYTAKSDVYSLGITICELANGFPPFERLEPKKLLLSKLSGAVPLIFDSSTHLEFISHIKERGISSEQSNLYSTRSISGSLHSLKNICCTPDYEERPTVDDLMNNDFFIESEESGLLIPCILPLMEFTGREDINDIESITWNF